MRTVSEFAAMDLETNIAEFERESLGEDDWVSFDTENAAFAIAERGEPGIVYLLDFLRSADTPHAQAALMALGAVKPVQYEAYDWLIRALDDDRPQVLFAGIHGLTWAEDRRHCSRIQDLLSHESAHVCSAAIKYIATLFPHEAIGHIDSALADERYLVRMTMLDELDETENEEFAKNAVSNAWKFVGDPHPHVRGAATWLLEHHHWTTRTPWEIAADRQNPDPFVRASALRASAHNNVEAIPDIIGAGLRDPDQIVRVNALDELEELYSAWYNHPKLPELVDISGFLKDEDPIIRDAANEAQSAWERRLAKSGEAGD